MTLVDLNPMEMQLIIELLKFDIKELKSRSAYEYASPDQLLEWRNHIKSVIYKLEKALTKK